MRSHAQKSGRSSARQQTACGRRAFTLVEVLLALALTSVLMLAIYQAISLAARLQVMGRDRFEDAQIQRSVVRMMTRDVHSVVFYVPEDDAVEEEESGQVADLEDEVSAEEEEEDTTTTVEVVDATSAYAQEVTGVYGNGTTLLLHINRPPRDMNYTTLVEGGSVDSRNSDLRSVSYFLATTSGDPLPALVATEAMSNGQLTATRDGTVGLARMEGDRLAMEAADVSSDLPSMAAQSRIIAPEVIGLQFRYFDGTAWLEAWDTEYYGSVPRAIEVSLGMKQPEGYQPPGQAKSPTLTEPPPRWQTFVIHLPITEPPSEEALF